MLDPDDEQREDEPGARKLGKASCDYARHTSGCFESVLRKGLRLSSISLATAEAALFAQQRFCSDELGSTQQGLSSEEQLLSIVLARVR